MFFFIVVENNIYFKIQAFMLVFSVYLQSTEYFNRVSVFYFVSNADKELKMTVEIATICG